MKTFLSLALSMVMGSNLLLASGFHTDIVRIKYERVCAVRSFDVTFPANEAAIALGYEEGDVGNYPEPRLTLTTYNKDGKRLRYYPMTTPELEGDTEVYTLKRYRSMDSETIGMLRLTDGKGSLVIEEEGDKNELVVKSCISFLE